MVKSLNNDVLSKVDEIVKYIEDSDTYKKYKEIEKCKYNSHNNV